MRDSRCRAQLADDHPDVAPISAAEARQLAGSSEVMSLVLVVGFVCEKFEGGEPSAGD